MKKTAGVLFFIFGIVALVMGLLIGFMDIRHNASWLSTIFNAGIWLIGAVLFFRFAFRYLKTADESMSVKKGILLKQNALPQKATIVNVAQITNVRVNGRSPYVIHAQLPNSTTLYKSQYIWQDILFNLQQYKTVDVYFDAAKSTKYYMDLESVGII